MNPKHDNPTRPDRIARAPYNFVPLPEQVVPVDYKIPEHDTYSGHTGYLDCTLTTKTPTYTRTALNPEFFTRWAADTRSMMRDNHAKETYAQFFHLDDAQQPVIPGSSLRGMTRSLIEIAGYGKVQWVTKRHLFFRTVDNTAVGQHYRDRMANKVEGGFLHKRSEQYFIRKCQVARVHRKKLESSPKKFYIGRTPNLTPRWTGRSAQYMSVWVKLSANGKFVERIEHQQIDRFQEGRLVITGDVPGKKKEFVFLLPMQDAKEITVSDQLIQRFHDGDQITQWQEKAFPKDRPQRDCRQRDGVLRKGRFLQEEGDPVFFLVEKGELTFFGRANMFRLPYIYSPFDVIPSDPSQQDDLAIDLAEAIFGYVKEGGHTSSRAGRVFFTDAICEPNQGNIWLSKDVIIPQILGSPKPTTFQHYLVQDKEKEHDPDNKRQLAHYGTPTPDETVIRGHKLYWHKHEGLTTADFSESEAVAWNSDTQHTQIKPVGTGVTFRFRVYFENLTDVELGALLWVLDLPDGHHHKIGMGKPLGLGSVAIEPRMVLTDRPARYHQLLEGNGWHTGEREETTWQQFQEAFEQYILDNMDQEERDGAQNLAQVPRIQMLLTMLKYPGPATNTDYMELSKFRDRKVLPDPLYVEETASGATSKRTSYARNESRKGKRRSS